MPAKICAVEDLQLGQLRGLKRKVRILNAASSCRQIGRDVREVVNCVAQAIGHSPKLRALDVHRCNGCVDLGRTAARALPPGCKRHGRSCGGGFPRIDVAGITPAKH